MNTQSGFRKSHARALLEPPIPPDCYAAHIAELPKPGSRVFDAQDALAVALIYNSADPDLRKEVENLREDLRAVSDQNQNLHTYSQLIYEIANSLRKNVVDLLEDNAKAMIELQKLRGNEDIEGRRAQFLEATTALKTVAAERDAYKSELDTLKIKLQTADSPEQSGSMLGLRHTPDPRPTQPSQHTPSFEETAIGAKKRQPKVPQKGTDIPNDRLAERRFRNSLAARRHRERKAQAALENERRVAALAKEVENLRMKLAVGNSEPGTVPMNAAVDEHANSPDVVATNEQRSRSALEIDVDFNGLHVEPRAVHERDRLQKT